ncbi:MAG: c-type cytochrome [Myxococcaceae bacterium]|nr:c-type cytochrome [Myxococcaceae bacterium]
MPLRLVGLLLVAACGSELPPASVGIGGGGAGTTRQPAPLFGGTVAVALDGRTVAVSDPDRDLLWIVDVDKGVQAKVTLPAGSQPGRAIDDGQGHFVVALRKRGQVARVSMATRTALASTPVCAEPRGLSRAEGGLLLACATGEVMRVAGHEATVVRALEREVRDVLEVKGQVVASAFREAELLDVMSGGSMGRPRDMAAFPKSVTPVVFEPTIAWRTLARADGEVVMVHQHERRGEPTTAASMPNLPPVPVSSGYGRRPPQPTPPPMTMMPTPTPTTPAPTTQGCEESVMRTAVTRFTTSGPVSFEVPGVLPVDAALSPDGHTLAIAHAASHDVTLVDLRAPPTIDPSCGPANTPGLALHQRPRLEHPVGLAFLPNGELLVHYRAPHVLVLRGVGGTEVTRFVLEAPAVESSGHRLFHLSTGSIACASCHPEGHDDGHVWTVGGQARRTQALSGGLLETAPFHWAGDLPELQDVMRDTFVSRMGGELPGVDAITNLGQFLEGLEAPRPLARAQAANVAAGRAAFSKAGCGTCHSGTKLGSTASMPIGKGAATQVPSLVGVSRRGPWMRDGCAKTLRARFVDASCGGASHGDAHTLTPAELDALVAYLEGL